jgi:hypothetical protein
VRFQATLTLGESTTTAAGEALGRLLKRHGQEPFMLAAVMTSAGPHAVGSRRDRAIDATTRTRLLTMAGDAGRGLAV